MLDFMVKPSLLISLVNLIMDICDTVVLEQIFWEKGIDSPGMTYFIKIGIKDKNNCE